MKITLINPPLFSGYPQPPLGLATIASVLERRGDAVTILDANALDLQPADVPGRVGDADLIGLTAMTPTIGTALEIARGVKRAAPERPVVLGGAHGTLLPEETLLQAGRALDAVILGEGEEIVVELADAIEQGRALDGIAGLVYRDGEEPRRTAPREGMVDMDSLPFPAYQLLADYTYHPHPPHGIAPPFMAMVTSRGCPYRCAYCSKPIFGSHFRGRSAEKVLDELAFLVEERGIREIAFYDDVFTLNEKRAMEICEGILARGLKFAWSCETRVNLVSEKLLALMKRAGCFAVAYGIESAAPDIVTLLNKDITLKQVEAAVRLTQNAGIQTIGYLMLGSPGETPQTIRETIDLAKKLKLDYAQFSLTTPYPATELYRIYHEQCDEPIPWDSFIYSGSAAGRMPVFESESLSQAELLKWVKRAYREFYLRPGYLWQQLRRMTSLSGLKVGFQGFKMLVGGFLRS